MNTVIKHTSFCGLLVSLLMASCSPEDANIDNGLAKEINPSFSIEPVTNKNNTYILRADPTDLVAVKWDKGDGVGSAFGKMLDTVFFPDAGTYTITLIGIGRGGVNASTAKDLVVDTSDPVSGNLIDPDNWTVLAITDGVEIEATRDGFSARGGNWGQQGIFQPIAVEANRKYKIDMIVSGNGGTDMWFEVFAAAQAPVQHQDYSGGEKRLALNTWAGCGGSPFNGKLSALSCDAGVGTITFDSSGTIYLVIKTGGAGLGTDGIHISKIEFRGIN